VAPRCNVQCNFCNRRYDCANECRPGVASRILKPGEVLPCLENLMRWRSDISVVGIAGPGDPLCDPELSLEALRAVNRAYPDLLICISTNGLNLPGCIDALEEAGVTHVTVTINAVDPEIGRHIYSWVKIGGTTYRGIEAACILLSRQRQAIVELKARGFVVKVNTVVIPGINAEHIPAIAKEAACLGADIMNCIPLIPVPDTPFEFLASPGDAEIERIRDLASRHIPQMYHCQRCRADAVGLLGLDELSEPRRPMLGTLPQ
jgi:nitrogen fixation protein NifB